MLGRFVDESVVPKAKVCSDDSTAYDNLINHETVKHSIVQYVKGMAHTNGIEYFWSVLCRGLAVTYHKMSTMRLNRYVQEFAERHKIRDLDTLEQMGTIFRQMDLKRLPYSDLTQKLEPV